LAQSEGLAPLPAPAASASGVRGNPAQTSETLTYNAAEHAPKATEQAKTDPIAAAAVPPAVTATPPKKKHSAFVRFFRRLFGAEE
jgi:glutamate-1-semialdehyde aminotransferase